MADRNKRDEEADPTAKHETDRSGQNANPPGGSESDRESQAGKESSTASRPRGHTEDPDRTL